MVLADDRILEYIREKDAAGSTEMAESDYVRYSQSYISRRSKELVEHGLLREVGNGAYLITERGKRYLDGEIDTSEDAPDEVESPFEGESGPSAGENHEQV
jgi:predicted transcriptional regulator